MSPQVHSNSGSRKNLLFILSIRQMPALSSTFCTVTTLVGSKNVSALRNSEVSAFRGSLLVRKLMEYHSGPPIMSTLQ